MSNKVVATILVLLGVMHLPPLGRAQSEPVSFTRHGDTIQVKIGDKPFTTYHFDPKTAKAYLQPLRDANGVVVTRGFPIGDTIPAAHLHDSSLEPHQRAMYFGHGNINGYDFWSEEVFSKYYGHETSRWGRMVFGKIDEMRGGSSSGTIRATFDLEGPDYKPFAQEIQQFTFRGTNGSRSIDCQIVIHAEHGPVTFGDTKEGTFAIRLAPELDAPRGNMVDSKGRQGEAQIWGKRADWVNVDGVINGHTLGVAIFDSPNSFRHPTYWHARGYGLLAANPFGLSFFLRDPKQSGSYTLAAGKSINFQYRVFIHDGNYKQVNVAEQYSRYAAHP
ncbi:MAG TPA: PmoA family protein [Acidobacteriaceae bacterium]|nr:PmoA family protein [Acidobacteriaceae bacterium]